MTNPQAIRQLNESRALKTLFRYGQMSRADLARRLQLTRSTVGSIVQSLGEGGLIKEQADKANEEGARVGRPGIGTELNADGAFFVGADIGVDRISVLAVDLACRIRFEEAADFRGSARPAGEVADFTAAMVRRAVGRLPGPDRVRGFCVAVPGFPSRDGRSYNAAILGWRNVPIRELLRQRLQTSELLVENDANAFAVAATYTGDDWATPDVLVVLIENGVGAGIVSGGRLFRGKLGLAGEIGHLRIGQEGFVFDPQRPGRMESYVGKDALLARYRYNGGQATALPEFLEALGRNEAPATRTAADWGRWLARALANAISILGPQQVILGGSVSAVYPFVADAIEQRLAASLIEGYAMPTIELYAGHVAGPALGGAYLMHQAKLNLGGTLDV